jgi:spermidine synthase
MMTGSPKRELVILPSPPLLPQRHLENCRTVASRDELLRRIDVRPGPRVAELGVFRGEFSRYLLDTLRPEELHLFDLDLRRFSIAEKFSTEIDQRRIFLHEGDSSTGLLALPDAYFDLIYIDGDHTYEGVCRDIEAAERKLAANGYLIFNDHTYWSPCECLSYGVMQAVNEFCERSDREAVFLALDSYMYCDIAIRRRVQVP